MEINIFNEPQIQPAGFKAVLKFPGGSIGNGTEKNC
jgi:hypothetical protein